ncbi:MAG: septum site-determining protein MinC [Bacillota bacterium]
MSSVFSFQAVTDGVLMNFRPDVSFEQIKSSVKLHAEEAGNFFKGVCLYINLNGVKITFSEMQQLMEILQKYNRVREIYFTAKQSSQKADSEGDKALIISRTLRSGQMIKHSKSVVIVGDVNPGAEVIAGEDIIVFGRLKGVVHAGAGGSRGAKVAALQLTPTQLRIASFIARSPDDADTVDLEPEKAYIKDGVITVEKL